MNKIGKISKQCPMQTERQMRDTPYPFQKMQKSILTWLENHFNRLIKTFFQLTRFCLARSDNDLWYWWFFTPYKQQQIN